MKVIITGGAGFIGCHLAELCLSKGHEVVVIDNLSNGSLKNIEFAKENERFTFIEADINSPEIYKKHFEDAAYVFHLAGLADIVPSIERPTEYHSANVEGTLKVMELCKNSNIKKVVYAASSSCYGIPDKYPTSETAPCKPLYPYALTKMIGEQYVSHWGKTYNIPTVSLRLFNVYGPKGKTNGAYGAVFKVFLAQKLAGKPYTVVGDGEQSRDFVYVTDVARAFYMAATSDVKDIVMNVGTGVPKSINQLVSLFGGPVEYIPKRPGEPDITQADNSKIIKELGWEPEVSFEEGVQKMLDNISYWSEAKVWDSSEIEHETKAWFACLGEK